MQHSEFVRRTESRPGTPLSEEAKTGVDYGSTASERESFERQPSESGSAANGGGVSPQPCYWLAARQASRGTGIEVLTLDPAGGGGVLPVFSFEEKAEMFLKLEGLRDEWRTRRTGRGELISLLFGLCGGVGSVVLDPLSENPSGRVDTASPVSLSRRSFARLAGRESLARRRSRGVGRRTYG